MIVDDIAYFGEPFFQDGPVAVAASEVAAEGVTYLSAAGNDNPSRTPQGHEIGSWETPEFRDSRRLSAELELVPAHPDHCLDFDPGGPAKTTPSGSRSNPKKR